jgi:hypothetical protein
MPAGQPTKYKAEHCELLEKMMMDGKSIIQFCAKVKICRKTFYNWLEQEEQFLHTFTRAKDYCEAFWETELQTMMYDRNVNAPLVKMYFANRFKWSPDRPAEEPAQESKPQKVTIEVVGANTSN